MAKNFIYTDMSAKNSLTLEIEGVDEFEVSQFTASWAASEVPSAAVMLAVGRNARTQDKAKIHESGDQLKQMQKAYVWFEPRGEFSRTEKWPGGRKKIFEGYFTGFAYRKIAGKVTVVGNLIHWAAALSFSSSLTKNGHVSSPSQLNAAAVLQSLKSSGAAEGHYISMLVSHEICADDVETDLWKGMKNIFCKLASIDTMPAGDTLESCGGDGNYVKNDSALYALNKVEGPADDCDKPYKHGVALKLETEGISTVADAIALAIGGEMVESYSSVTFWDKLITQFCPAYGLAFVPMVDSAIVVADTPAYSGGVWREIVIDDYDGYDMNRELHRPLRAVGVIATYESPTKAGIGGTGETGQSAETPQDSGGMALGGCHAEDSVEPGDGMIMYVASPSWLRVISTMPNYAGHTTGILGQKASKTSTTPVDPPKAPSTQGVNVATLYQKYAHTVYVNQMLRGQTGSFSGKLRFDIAPLSIVKLIATSEKFIGPGQDDMAETLIGCVQRVTVSINAEAGMAGTTFTVSHLRTEAENGESRTSVDEHPLFGKAIHGGGKHGSPLVDDFEFAQE